MFKLLCATLSFAAFLAWAGTRIVDGIQYGRHISGHLGLAASSNSIDLAKQEMGIALGEMEREGYTSGYTSVLYTLPSEDVGFWYSNLKASLTELQGVTPATSNLERSNILLKLHETLTAHKASDDSVFSPDGISIFPYNMAFAIWGWGSLLLAVLFIATAAADDGGIRRRF